MADLFNLDTSLNNYAVFGNPVKHSKSPRIHSLFAKQTGISLCYQAIEVPLDNFNDYVYAFFKQGGKGLNITVPFKDQAFNLCTSLSPRAEFAESVNTIWFGEGDIINGDTTDGQGLINDLINNHHLTLKDKSVLILGAGGSVKAILEPLIEQEPGRLVIVNRTLSKAIELADRFSQIGSVDYCSFENLKNNTFDLVINGTSSSLHGELPPLPDSLLNSAACCYDLMYSDEPTIFMKWAKSYGAAKVLDGLGMLVEQAAESFSIWHGTRPDTKSVISELRK